MSDFLTEMVAEMERRQTLYKKAVTELLDSVFADMETKLDEAARNFWSDDIQTVPIWVSDVVESYRFTAEQLAEEILQLAKETIPQ